MQRARATLDKAAIGTEALDETDASATEVVERYLAAFCRADVEGLVRLLADEVILEMPPMWNWYVGPGAYEAFMVRVFAMNGTDWRVVPVAANRQPAVAAYIRKKDDYVLHTLQVFTVGHGGVVRTTVYQDPAIFTLFNLAPSLA